MNALAKKHGKNVELLEHAVAAYLHGIHARPLFGILEANLDSILWWAGGTDFPDFIRHTTTGRIRLSQALTRMGVGAEIAASLFLDGVVTDPRRFGDDNGREFSFVCRRRADNTAPIQFTLTNVSAFAKAEAQARAMTATILEALDGGISPATAVLASLRRDVEYLSTQPDDTAIDALARSMVGQVDAVIKICIDVLRSFEEKDPPDEVLADPVMNRSHRLAWETAMDLAKQGKLTRDELRYAGEFARNAAPLLILAPAADRIIAIDGPRDGILFAGVSEMIRGVGVEENSIRTAEEFFSSLLSRPAHAGFAVADVNMEARGRPFPGGWQATLTPAATEALDVAVCFMG